MKITKWHRYVGVFSTIFLAVSALTGILWAYSTHLYFSEGYLKKKRGIEAPFLTKTKVTSADALNKFALFFHSYGGKGVESLVLRAEASKLTYLATFNEGKKQKKALMDAVTGNILSPIDEKFAIEIASQYVPQGSVFKSAEALGVYTHRKGRKVNNVYRVVFTGSETTEIFIDRASGEIIEESSPSRRFLFLMQKLHQLEFFGTKKELTIIPGASLLFLVITGILIWWRRFKRKNKF